MDRVIIVIEAKLVKTNTFDFNPIENTNTP